MNLENKIGNILSEKGFSFSVAESITGGKIGSHIVKVPGSSKYFKGGVIAYSNDIKINILKVSDDTLKKYGAVSKVTAMEMAYGVKNLFKTDVSVSVTGIAGPSGETKSKPIGLVFAGFCVKNKIVTKKYLLSGSRYRIIQITVKNVFTDLINLF